MATAPTTDVSPELPQLTWRDRWLTVRTWVIAQPRLAATIAISALTMIIAAVWLTIWLLTPVPKMVNLDTALAALDRGDERLAVDIAGQFLPWSSLPESRRWIPPLVFGLVNARRAERNWGDKQRQFYTVAANFLDVANEGDLPAGRRPLALFELGRSQLHSGRLRAAIPNLLAALPIYPREALATRRLLADAYMKISPPNWSAAFDQIQFYLADKRLDDGQREEGWLIQGKILGAQELFDAAQRTLDQIPEDSKSRAEAMFEQGRLLMHQAVKLSSQSSAPDRDMRLRIDDLYRLAIRAFDAAPPYDNWSTPVSAWALLFSARCRALNDQPEAALQRYAQIGRWYPDSQEWLVGQFESGEIHLKQGNDAAALHDFEMMFAEAPTREAYDNPWLPLEELWSRTFTAQQLLMRRNDYARAAALATAASRMPVDPLINKLGAEAYLTLGNERMRSAEAKPYREAEQLRADAIEAYRIAAHHYERLSKFRRLTRQYLDDVWGTAEAFRLAGDHPQALKFYDEYLASHVRPRRTQAILAEIECLLELGQVDSALALLEQTDSLSEGDLAKPHLPILSARAHLLKGDFAAAEKSLRSLLEGELLTPAAKDWQTALFLLGQLLYDENRLDEAQGKLEEAVTRYPKTPKAREALYLLAETYRRTAEQVEVESRQEGLNDDDRQQLELQARTLFGSALDTYQKLIVNLEQRDQSGQITPDERPLLRNAIFARGAALHALGRYDEAINAYLAAVNQYQDTPEVLDALVQIAFCYRRLQRPIEARGTLLQARLVLERLPSEALFTNTTNFNRDEWAQWLASLIAM